MLLNSQIPYIGDYVRIVCSLCNKYRPPITSGTFDDDIAIASKMTMLAKKTNELQQFVLENGNLKKIYVQFFFLYLYYIHVHTYLKKHQWRCTGSNDVIETLLKGPYVGAVAHIKIMVSLSKSFYFVK